MSAGMTGVALSPLLVVEVMFPLMCGPCGGDVLATLGPSLALVSAVPLRMMLGPPLADGSEPPLE